MEIIKAQERIEYTMDCCNHPNKEAQGICVNCGKPYCADCLVQIDDKNYCKDCIRRKVEDKTQYYPHSMQQQQQQDSDAFPNLVTLDFTNLHLAFIALVLFLVSIAIFAFSGGNLYMGLLGTVLLIAALAVGFYYALVLLKEKEKTKMKN
ncbi:MAG: hypothetical protein ABSB80_05110 [Methanoregula sp.]|jgi:hypothetical protein|uniref:B-box zinc finger protein n=1 Tax=Methanoregula sp. TaxID=2052170 RepID=UPI003D0FF850